MDVSEGIRPEARKGARRGSWIPVLTQRLLGSQLRINMASGMATTGINTVLMAVGYPVYLHFLGYEQYGVWLVLTTVLTFAQLGNLGIGPAVMKLVAEEHGRHDILGIQRYVTTALTLLTASGTVVLAVILLARKPIIGLFGLADENARTALWLLPYIGVLSIYVFVVQVFEATLSGLGRMDLANCRGVLARLINLCVSGLLLLAGCGVGALLVGRVAAEVITHLALLLSIRRIIRARILRLHGFDMARGKRLLSFGGMVFGGSLLNMLFSPLNKLILSRYAGVATVPVYEIALTATMQIRGFVTAGQGALVPEISRIGVSMTTSAKDRISQLYRQSLRLMFLLGTPVFTSLAILAPLLLRLWLGDRFVETLPGTFRIMLVGTFLSIFGVPASCLLMGMGAVRHTLGAQVVGASMNLAAILCITTLLHTSLSVVAWSSAMAMTAGTFYLIVQNGCVLKRLGTSGEIG